MDKMNDKFDRLDIADAVLAVHGARDNYYREEAQKRLDYLIKKYYEKPPEKRS